MPALPDPVLQHLREVADLPDLSATKYSLIEPLGRGGMGTVYLVQDTELDRLAALKVVGTSLSMMDGSGRLRVEATILARLDHPGIVPVYDVGALPDGRSYYAMKYVRGERLDEHVERQGPTLLGRLQLLERICEAVAFAHSRGVVHCDLKPQNIMVGQFGEVLVMDWGLSVVGRQPSSADTEPPRLVAGTPGYMAPEQERGEPIDERADVHALGAIMQMLLATGRDGSGAALPPALVAVSGKARSAAPDDRYQRVADLASELVRYREGLPLEAYPENIFRKAARIFDRYRIPIVLVLAYLVMRLILLLLPRG
jgi:serine/threonine protein kinase